jgi:hypothetical protein
MKEEKNMSKSKILGMMALIAFAMGIFLVGDVMSGERGKNVAREVYYATTIHTLKVPDVEGHSIYLFESKGIGFSEKWGSYLIYHTTTLDLIKGEGTHQGYAHSTFPDGSTITLKFAGKNFGTSRTATGSQGSEGTYTYIKGTGKFEGIQGRGAYKSYHMGQGQWYTDGESEYMLP